MAYNSGLAPQAVYTYLDLVFNSELQYQQMPGMASAENGMIFMQSDTDRQRVVTEQFMGTGYWQPRTEQQDVHQSTARVGNEKSFPVLNFADSVDIGKHLFDDDQHETIEMLMKNFGRNARMTRDRYAMDQYRLGFTTVTTNDGVALFSNSHTTLSGDTVDNLLTDALSDASLEDAIVMLIEQRTQDGTLGSYEPAVLLVPPALFKEAQIITKSELRSGTANNDMNYYSQVYPGLMVYQSPFLGATYGGSNTAWFLLSRNHSMYRWIRQGVQTRLVDWENQRNNNYIYKGEFREVVGPISFEGMVASNGTT